MIVKVISSVISIEPDIKIPLKSKKSIKVNNLQIRDEHLEKSLEQRIKKIMERHAEIFGPINDNEIIDTNIKAEIRTSTEEPIYSKMYPYPVHMWGEVDNQIRKLLEDGIIRPSKSPYHSPIWIVSKKPDALGEKEYGLVIDFRRLNAVTIPDTYPIPDIFNTLASLGNPRYFTTLDLTSGFLLIKMQGIDIRKTAFSTLNGKYEFSRLPFGLKNAPAIFQRTIDDVLKEYIGKICYVYRDEIVILGKDEEEHLKNLETIF